MLSQANEYLVEMVLQGGPKENEHQLFFDCLKSSQDLSISLTGSRSLDWLKSAMGDALSYKTVQGLAYKKLHGVFNDYELSERTYGHYIAQEATLKNWDELWHRQGFAAAINDQKRVFKETLRMIEAEHVAPKVLDVGVGSARGIYEYLSEYRSYAYFYGIDADQEAVDYAKLLCRNFHQQTFFDGHTLQNFRTDNKFQLVWATGVFDFFTDAEFKDNLRKLVYTLAPGCTLILNNVCCTYQQKHYLEFLDWKINYRSSGHLRYLAESIGINPEFIEVSVDAFGVSNYLKITAPQDMRQLLII